MTSLQGSSNLTTLTIVGSLENFARKQFSSYCSLCFRPAMQAGGTQALGGSAATLAWYSCHNSRAVASLNGLSPLYSRRSQFIASASSIHPSNNFAFTDAICSPSSPSNLGKSSHGRKNR